MNGARYFAGRSGGAASDFESARLAMAVARAIEHGGAVIDEGAGRAQRFAARADVDVASRIVRELLAGEGAVGSSRFLDDGDMRFDCILL